MRFRWQHVLLQKLCTPSPPIGRWRKALRSEVITSYHPLLGAPTASICLLLYYAKLFTSTRCGFQCSILYTIPKTGTFNLPIGGEGVHNFCKSYVLPAETHRLSYFYHMRSFFLLFSVGFMCKHFI